MTSKASYAPEEWTALTELPGLVAAAAALADGAGLISTARELAAGVRAVREGAHAHAGNELIGAILAEMAAYDEAHHPEPGHEREGADVGAERFLTETITTAAAVREILAAKSTPEEAAGYTAWVMAIVTDVIGATKRGGFLGIGGERVDQEEAAFRDDLAAALGA